LALTPRSASRRRAPYVIILPQALLAAARALRLRQL
jgi:hypothetical protein